MKSTIAPLIAASILVLTGCEDETEEPVVDRSETGGEAAGEVLGGTISDAMIPLEELTSSSPPAERRPATSTSTTVTQDDDGSTTVETVTTSTTTDAPAPAPPEPPTAPE